MRRPRARRNRQAGLTLMEIMIAIAILVFMMSMAWTTLSRTGETMRYYQGAEERAHELRVGLARVVADLEQAYLSRNEDVHAIERRTHFIGKDTGQVDELSFSSLGHQVLWAEANESDQTLISYVAERDREDSRKTNWLRREQRRLTDRNESSRSMPAEVDVVLRDIEEVGFAYWDWRDQSWRTDWDTTKADGQKDRLPTRVKVTVRYREGTGVRTLTTQARLYLQEPVESRFGTQYDRGGP
jgi:prepilin-type N-terminal cleavage/methylation domain-containing protein